VIWGTRRHDQRTEAEGIPVSLKMLRTDGYNQPPDRNQAPLGTAKEFTLADRMFQSNTGPSFVAHQYMIAGQSAGADENPSNNDVFQEWGCDSPGSTSLEAFFTSMASIAAATRHAAKAPLPRRCSGRSGIGVSVAADDSVLSLG
jgi:hypothetical protein